MQKSESTGDLRSKRNTIAASSRPSYSSSSLSTMLATKRHSSVSPLPPHARTTTSAALKPSLLPKSTPSSPPGQTRAASTSFADSMSTRISRQHQQLKDYSLGVKNSMTHLASLSGVGPLSSLMDDDFTQSLPNMSPGLRRMSAGAGGPQAPRPLRRSNSDFLAMKYTSTNAMKLLKQQEEPEPEDAQDPPKSFSRNRRRSQYHTDDIDEYPGSVAYEHGWSSFNESARLHRRNFSELGYEGATRRRESADSLSHKYQREESQRRQSNLSSDKYGSTSERHQSQDNGGNVDATAFTTLYREIRDSMDAATFGMFAAGTCQKLCI